MRGHVARAPLGCRPRARLAPPSGGPVGSRGAGAGLRKPRREGWRGCRPIGATSPRIRHGIPDVGPAHMSCEGDRRLRTGRVFAGRGGPRIPLAQGSWIASSSAARRSTSDLPTPEGRGTERHAELHPDIAAESQRVLGQHQNAAGKPLGGLSPSTSFPHCPRASELSPGRDKPSARRFRPLTGGTHRLRPQCPGLPHSGRKRCENGPSVAPQGVCTAEKQGATPITRWWMLLNLAGLRSSCAQSANTTRARAVRRRRGLSKQPQRTRVSGRALRGSARRPGPEGPAGPRERPGR